MVGLCPRNRGKLTLVSFQDDKMLINRVKTWSKNLAISIDFENIFYTPLYWPGVRKKLKTLYRGWRAIWGTNDIYILKVQAIDLVS